VRISGKYRATTRCRARALASWQARRTSPSITRIYYSLRRTVLCIFFYVQETCQTGEQWECSAWTGVLAAIAANSGGQSLHAQ
jgi:hypothetical protein